MTTSKLKLQFGEFKDLFDPAWLAQLDERFLERLGSENPALCADLLAYRHQKRLFTPEATSALLIACAPLVEEFIAELFGIQQALEQSLQATLSQNPIFDFKHWYVQRQAKRRLLKQDTIASFQELNIWLDATLKALGWTGSDQELLVAELGQMYLKSPETHADQIEQLISWCVRAMTDPDGKALVKNWVSFHLPDKLDYYQLVPLLPVQDDPIGRLQGPPEHHRQRDGFKLTDPRMTQRQVLGEIDYCVYCHENAGDFCSKGFPVKKGEPDKGFKTNPLGEAQTGCPLEEKISEMHVLKKDGHTIAALAMIMVDNPMCPATGHRICNDCMKGCIYQKQDPVNIPQTETGILTDVLALPWGVEIYDLLTRWNPLRKEQWVAKPYNGQKVLVMGMGPAGFSLAHHLLMEGCAVVGVDGLKIEPLSAHFVEQPIHRYEDIKEDLDARVMAGFGGVAEYGITVRWDKNFLKLIYISLMRRPYFQVFGGVRFGGTVKVEDAWQLGFSHMAIAVGAGLPKALPIPGSMAPGMRQANDFLMALQLTGAAKKNSLANLQVRLPAVIIGGGLTGIDTATEVQAYYIEQVEKTLERYEVLTQAIGEARLQKSFDAHSFEILNEFIVHGRQVQEERKKAAEEQRAPDFLNLLREWGGVTVAYRRLLRESPAYLRNHEEVTKALEEGIYYAEGLTPKAVRLDQFGHVEALVSESRIYTEKGEWMTSDEEHILPARSIFVATGAQPNVAYEFEHSGTFHRERFEYKAYNSNGHLTQAFERDHCKVENFGAFTSYQKDNYRVTFLGDTHPVFHGSVVKAIASGKRTYPKIMEVLAEQEMVGEVAEYQDFSAKIAGLFQSHIVKVVRHTPSVIELEVHAPMATQNYKPGHFYRLQNFETSAAHPDSTLLQTEAMAMLAARVNQEAGTITFMVLEEGASSRLLATMQPGSAIALMGPTGVRTKIPEENETVLMVGGRQAAAHLLAVGPAMRAAGNKVLFVGGFKTAEEVFCQADLEAAADKIVWITQHGEPVKTQRAQDIAVTSDYLSALTQYAMGALEPQGPEIPLEAVDRVLVVGRFSFLRLIQNARRDVLKPYFVKHPQFIASVYGPMQCMLKGVCAQCLTWQIDPETGKRTKAVFACSWHDQPFDQVDIDNIEERLVQNRTQEILTNLWLDYLLSHYGVERV